MKRYNVLDGMRGVIALCVMLNHTSTEAGYPIFQSAYMAVDFFYVISGFVIAHTYGSRGDMSFGYFIGRRMLRLYSMYLIGVLSGGLVLLIGNNYNLSDYSNGAVISSVLCNLVFVPYFNEGNIFHNYDSATHGVLFPGNDALWSLSFEVMTNLLFLSILSAGPRRLLKLVGGFYIAIVVTGFISALSKGRLGVDVGGGWQTISFVNGLPRSFYSFYLGVLLWVFLEDPRLHAKLQRLRVIKFEMYAIFAMLILIFSVPYLRHLSAVYYLFVVGIVSPFLVLSGIFASCNSPMSLRLTKFLGGLSYPLYCIHIPVMRVVEIQCHHGWSTPLPSFVVSSVVSIALAIFLTKFYDEPVRAWLTRVFSPPSRARTTS